jgi:peptidoglycan/xylan/chitin deacetylase (PgdA/CDA1 family)
MSSPEQPSVIRLDSTPDTSIPGPVRDLVGYGRRKPKVQWPGNASVACTITVNYEEGSEYSWDLGDKRSDGMSENYSSKTGATHRDLKSESTYEYGSRAGFWRLFDMFDEYSVPVSLFACGVALERNPEVSAYLRESEHEVCGHGWRYEEPWLLSREEEAAHIREAVQLITDCVGRRPVGWFSRSSPSVNTRELLVEEGGFVYDCDSVNDDLPYFTEVLGRRHLIVPYTEVYNDGRFVRGQGYGNPSDFFESCRQALDELKREGERGYPKMLSVGIHPRWIGQAGRAHAVRQLIEYANEIGGIWFARRNDIADWWLSHKWEY